MAIVDDDEGDVDGDVYDEYAMEGDVVPGLFSGLAHRRQIGGEREDEHETRRREQQRYTMQKVTRNMTRGCFKSRVPEKSIISTRRSQL